MIGIVIVPGEHGDGRCFGGGAEDGDGDERGDDGCGDDRGKTVVETSLARVARWGGTRARVGETVVVVRVASDIARVARSGRETMSVVR